MKQVNIKLFLNRINEQDVSSIVDYAKSYNLKHGITINVEIETVNVTGYQSSEFAQVRTGINYCVLLGAENLVIPDETKDINVFCFDQSEWRTPQGSPYPLKPDTPTSDTILVQGRPFINFGIYPPDLNGDEITFCHELMHAYAKIAVSEGYKINDIMDLMTLPDGEIESYYLNSTPDAVNGNFINMWEQFYNSGFLKI